MAALWLRALWLCAAAIPPFAGSVAAQAAEACRADRALAEIVSVTGDNHVVAPDGARRPAYAGDLLCPGDMLETGPDGSADIRLPTRRTVIGVHNNTEIRLPGPSEPVDLELSYGLMRFLSSVRSLFVIRTPFVDAGIEGTEAIVAALSGSGDTLVLVAEGEVGATDRRGAAGTSLRLAKDEAAAAGLDLPLARVDAATAPPAFRSILVAPDAASDWAIYYPPILLTADGRDRRIAIAADRLRAGDPEGAERLLAAEFKGEDRALALSLRAIVAVFRNRRDQGLGLADAAVAAGPGLGSPLIALSYALQAAGRVEAARDAAKAATEAAPEDAFAWSRLAELALVLANARAGRAAAERSLALAETSLGRSMLGFASLAALDASAAAEAFRRAILLDSASPLPRLGLGLALVRRGEIERGRAEIETAVALDPRRANLRAWLARAYLAEGDAPRARAQIAAAQEADPDDPTADLFLAQERFSANDPIGALGALREAEAKGGARATVRGRPGLGEDRAVRTVALGRVYDTLGFDSPALVAAAAAVEADPSNPGARRFLADVYRGKRGFEIAAASEYLKHQLLAPPSLDPIQVELRETDLGLLDTAGAARVAFHEFGPVFDTEGHRLDISGSVGTQDLFSGQVSAVALKDNLSFGLGLFGLKTEGVRRNNDIDHRILSLQGKAQVSPDIQLFGEYRRRRTVSGDRTLEFDLQRADADRRRLNSDELLLGGSVRLSEDLTSLGLARFVSSSFQSGQRRIDDRAFDVQSQLIGNWDGLVGTVGFQASHFDGDNTQRRYHSVYGFLQASPTTFIDLVGGVGIENFLDRSPGEEKSPRSGLVVNPKFGIRARLDDRVAVRLGYARTTQRIALVEEQLEPTTILGFNQTSPDSLEFLAGQRLETVFGALDVEPGDKTFLSFEFGWSRGVFAETSDLGLALADHRIVSIGARSAFVINSNSSLDAALLFQRENTQSSTFNDELTLLSVPVNFRYFDASGISFTVGANFFHHSFEDLDDAQGRIGGESSALSIDLEAAYRLRDDRGILSLQARNLLNDRLAAQDRLLVSSRDAVLVSDVPRERMIALVFSSRF